MVRQVTEQWLERVCGGRCDALSGPTAYRIAVQMGPLAPWWLRAEVLEKARSHAFQLHGDTEENRKRFSCWEPVRQVPQESGCCWLLLVNRCPEELGLLRSAFVLPVRWVKGQSHHRHLPGGLRRLADNVLDQLRKEKELDQTIRWGLWPAWDRWLEQVDLSGLEWEWESAWAALAAGVLLAYWEGSPDPTVWATGAYQPDRGISRVEGVGQKALAAWQMGARVLFVPPGQDEEVKQFFSARGISPELEVASLSAGAIELRKCLESYLARLEVPPAQDASQALRRGYFLRIPDDAKARQYYASHILPEVRTRWAQQLNLSCLGITHLITIVSKGFDLVALAVGVVQPERCCLLFNRDLEAKARALPQHLKEMGFTCSFESVCFTGNTRKDMVEEFQKAIQQFQDGLPPQRVVVDLTPGQRMMNLALYDVVPEGSFVVHCQAEMDDRTRRPIPFTEQFELWQIVGQRKWKNAAEIGQ